MRWNGDINSVAACVTMDKSEILSAVGRSQHMSNQIEGTRVLLVTTQRLSHQVGCMISSAAFHKARRTAGWDMNSMSLDLDLAPCSLAFTLHCVKC